MTTVMMFTPKAKLAKAAQAEGQKKGASAGGKAGGRGRPIASGATCPKGYRDESKRTRSQAASAVGMSARTYEKAKVVVESGDAALIAKMDTTKKVDTAYKHVKKQEQQEAKRSGAICAKPKRDSSKRTTAQAAADGPDATPLALLTSGVAMVEAWGDHINHLTTALSDIEGGFADFSNTEVADAARSAIIASLKRASGTQAEKIRGLSARVQALGDGGGQPAAAAKGAEG